jgi:cobalt-precorrin-5B (C1)-methyltransferase
MGFTTGTSAAAAVKGAVLYLVTGRKPGHVTIPFLSAGSVNIAISVLEKRDEKTVFCSVIKEGGDDPDVTNKAEIAAKVSLMPADTTSLILKGGHGVGRVTKPGLEVPEGEAAINPGPRQMIEQAVFSALGHRTALVEIEIIVPNGEKIAEKTLNKRLGILGGISILGTTGVEKPMSHEAYIATIKSSLNVAVSAGIDAVVFTTGRRSERFSMALMPEKKEEAFIQTGDFFQASLLAAAESGIKNVVLGVFFGKALKMAQKVPHTHAAKSELSLKKLSDWTIELTGDQDAAERICACNTAREAFEWISGPYPQIVQHVGNKMIEAAESFAAGKLNIDGIIYDFNGNPVFTKKTASGA